MILKRFCLNEGIGEWDSDARKEERVLLTFCASVADTRMRSALRSAKLATDGVAQVAIVPVVERSTEPRLFAGILPVHVPFDWQAFSDWQGEKRAVCDARTSDDAAAFSELHGSSEVIRDMICDAMLRGLQRIPASFKLPIETLGRIILEIQSSTYQLAWTHSSHRFAGLKLTARLDCLLLAGKFQLSLTVLRGKHIAWTKVIYSSWPESIFWHSNFKDVALRGDSLVVTRRIPAFNPDRSLNHDLYTLPLNAIPIENA
ncbi:MAG: hypothetical protein HC869_17830 [Rhodospirillales bacterium]|nr:hypothetical protein [Rhodospirillales bacterium]